MSMHAASLKQAGTPGASAAAPTPTAQTQRTWSVAAAPTYTGPASLRIEGN